MTRIGPYQLQRPIARGGMGDVWQAEHGDHGLPVAIKVLAASEAQEAGRLRAFQNEVRAAAGLDHPNIIRIYDYGQVARGDAESAEGALEAGSPYVVMEYGEGGSLRPLCGQLKWPEVRHVLASLLEGLAHAHARGVIHRDIKPANVVVNAPEGGGLAPKLTDFGVAAAIYKGAASTTAARSGTPMYMAPEQIEGTWRDQGPWTDLYSLGCLAYALVSGEPPFRHLRTVVAVASAHLRGEIPELRPRCEVPAGLTRWLSHMLEKAPHLRFQRAAEARAALLRLPAGSGGLASPLGTSVIEAVPAPVHEAEITDQDVQPPASDATVTVEAPSFEGAESGGADEGHGSEGSGGAETRREPPETTIRDRRIPVPEWRPQWREAARGAPTAELVGAGLGLYGMRSLPMVGRQAQRDHLWRALGRACQLSKPQVVLLSGPAGCGKSRLGQWICERAHERGVASVLKAVHSPTGSPNDGLGHMLARELRATDLSEEAAIELVSRWLALHDADDPDEARALVELMRGSGMRADADDAYHFASVRERYLVLERFLAHLTEERPVVMWLDDVQWGLDSLGFVMQLLEGAAHAALPVLVVMTAQDEALAERPAERRELAQIVELVPEGELRVGPLSSEAHATLIREMLGLEGDLAVAVEQRTAGSPLFAVQLVGDWVARGLLELGPRGFRLKEGARAELPDSLHHVWSARIDDALAGRPEEEEIALELAAALGHVVDLGEWEHVGRLSGDAIISSELVERLLKRRLWQPRDRRGEDIAWTFVHPMLRESLERRARERERWVRHNRVCAELIRETGWREQPERLARCLIQAGAYSEALEPLLEAGRALNVRGDFRRAGHILAEREKLAERSQLPADDPRWGAGWLEAALTAIRSGRASEAQELVERTRAAADKHGWEAVGVRARYKSAWLLQARGAIEEALELLVQTLEQAREVGDEELLGSVLERTARVLMDLGQDERAAEALREAIGRYEGLRASIQESQCRLHLAWLSIRAGRLNEADSEINRAVTRLRALGARGELGIALNNAGELARAKGDLDEAEQLYREALRIQRMVGAGSATITELNLGVVLATRGQYEAARRVFVHCLSELERQLPRFLGAVHIEVVLCGAHLRDWVAFDKHLAEGGHLLAASGFVDADVAEAAKKAGDAAHAAGESARARRAGILALEQYRRIGNEAAAYEVESAISRLNAAS